MYLKSSKKASVAGAERVRGGDFGDEDRVGKEPDRRAVLGVSTKTMLSRGQA